MLSFDLLRNFFFSKAVHIIFFVAILKNQSDPLMPNNCISIKNMFHKYVTALMTANSEKLSVKLTHMFYLHVL